MSNERMQNDVAILGCGNMGAAFARALLASGRKVAVWNRTESRVQPLAELGADAHSTPEGAARSSAVVIVCVATAADAREVIEKVGVDEFGDRTVLNVTSGTPDEARELGRWATSHGLRYLDGAILAYPEQIGGESTRILVAGSDALWQENETLIRTLGGLSAYTSDDFGSAAVVDTGLVGSFYFSTLVAFIEAVRYMTHRGVPISLLTDMLGDTTTTLQHQLGLLLRRIEADDYTTDEATLQVYAMAAQSFSAAMDVDGGAPISRLASEILTKGVEAGYGEVDLAAIYQL
ncbi:NAD(P)-dependent oxidoreductase [Nocardioides ultimimeridianus]